MNPERPTKAIDGFYVYCPTCGENVQKDAWIACLNSKCPLVPDGATATPELRAIWARVDAARSPAAPSPAPDLVERHDMHRLLGIFEDAAKGGDDLNGDPSKWSVYLGVAAVIAAISPIIRKQAQDEQREIDAGIAESKAPQNLTTAITAYSFHLGQRDASFSIAQAIRAQKETP